MGQKKLLVVAVVVILIAAGAVLVWQNNELQKELQQARTSLAQSALNGKALDFLLAFVDKVLRAKGEVSFDDRLQLENMVRDLKDDAVLAEWNKFVNSKTPEGAQEEVKNLLDLLVHKIRTQ